MILEVFSSSIFDQSFLKSGLAKFRNEDVPLIETSVSEDEILGKLIDKLKLQNEPEEDDSDDSRSEESDEEQEPLPQLLP